MKKDGQNEPATQKDLELWGGNLVFQIDEVRKDLNGVKDDLNGVKQYLHDFRQESNERFDRHDAILEEHTKVLKQLVEYIGEMSRSIERNTDSMAMFTKEFQEIKHIEFQVYNHEKRIIKLEKSR